MLKCASKNTVVNLAVQSGLFLDQMRSFSEDTSGDAFKFIVSMSPLASVFAVSIDPVNNCLAVSGGEDDKAYVWRIEDGQIQLECHGNFLEVITCLIEMWKLQEHVIAHCMPLAMFNPFTPDSAKSEIDKFSKITNWLKL